MTEQQAARNPAPVTATGPAEPQGSAKVNYPGSVRKILYPVILLVFPFIFFLPGTRGDLMLGDGDAFVQFMPFWKWAAEQWSNWTAPFWSPHIFAGFPLMAEPQAGVFHPDKLLFLFLDPLMALNVTVLIFYGLAGLFTYLLAREEDLTPEASLLGGIAFAYSGFLIGHQAITALFITAASFPVIFYVFRLTLRRADYLSVFWGMLAVLFVVLNGHPQFTFYALFFAGFYALYLLFFVLKARPARVAFGKRVVAIYVLGAGLAAFQLLPTLELMVRSVRDKVTYQDFVAVSFPPPTLLASLISTRLYHLFPNDGSEAMVDVGLWVLLLAVAGFWLARRAAAFWIFLFAFSALLFVGNYTPLYHVMYWVPGYNLFRVASRNGIAVDFAVAMLAAWGLTAVQKQRPRRGWGLAVLGAVPLLYYWTLYKPDQRIFDRLYKAVAETGAALPWTLATVRKFLLPLFPELLLMCAGALVILFLLKRLSGGLLIGIVAVSLAITHFWEYRNWIFAAPAAEVQASLQPQQLLESLPHLKDPLPSRIVFGGAANWISFLQKDRATWRKAYVGIGGVDVNMLHGVSSISGYTPLIEKDFARLAGNMHMSGTINEAKFFSSPAIDLLNVEYVVTASSDLSYPPETFSRLEIWKKTDQFTVYRNPRALGFFWPVQTLMNASEDEFWQQMAQPSVDFSKTAVLVESKEPGLVSKTFGDVSRLKGAVEGPNRIVLDVEAREPAFLASSHPLYPGWRATVDGNRTDINRINGIFCGIAIPAGSHRVVLRFVPTTFWLGLFLSLLSLAALVAVRMRDFLRLRHTAA